MELRRLVFEKGIDVAAPTVLAAVAARNGVTDLGNVDAVLAEYDEGRARHVVGSPHFFVDELSMFCPTLDIKRVDGALRVNLDTEAFSKLVTACFE